MSARSWCFTLNNYTFAELMSLEELECRYMIYGLEVGADGTEHVQGYIEMGKVMRLAGMKKLITRAHFEQRRGTREAARDYCKKDGEWLEFGNWEKGGRGARNDLKGAMEMVREHKPLREIYEEMPVVAGNNMRFIDRYIALVEKDETKVFRKLEVNVLVGDAGSGKTRIVHEICPDVFTVNAGEAFPFDGYDGEDAILIDDFYGDIKYHEFLRILDGHQYRVNVKGSHRYARWTKVFITSNKAPKDWYQRGLTPALARRIHHVTTFGNEEPGNTEPALEI